MNASDAINVGDQFASAEYGPLTIVDTVRWAGVQENSERVHFDREFARESGRMQTFIASGGFRQALLARALTDRIGLRGRLLKLSVRHVAPTFESDLFRCSARVLEKSPTADGMTVVCEVEGRNQRDEQVMVGRCVLLVR